MKRHHKSADGLYHIKGKTYKVLVGSRAQVGNETAFKTSGGLEKKDLIYINGRWKSEKKHKTAKREQRLRAHGYGAKKGKFGYVKITPKTQKNRGSSPPRVRRAHTLGGRTLKKR